MTKTEERISALFKELVPFEGKADTVAGEIIRATCRIGYRFYNDGDQLGIGYGKETVNPAARYLQEWTNNSVINALSYMWELYDSHSYEAALEKLNEAVLAYIEEHPELKTKENTEDMWEYKDALEDVDDSGWDEDDEY